MTIYPMARRKQPSLAPAFLKVIIAVGGGFALFFFACLALLFAGEIAYSGKIYPGISAAGIDLTGLTEDEAATLLLARVTYPQTGQIGFIYGEKLWSARPEELGLYMDSHAIARLAYLTGRSGGIIRRVADQLTAWHSGKDTPLALIFDQRQVQDYLGRLAAEIDQPTLEASLTVNGLDVVAVTGQVGRRLDVPATISQVETQIRSLTDGLVTLAVVETPPQIMDAGPAAEAARRILSAPLSLVLPDAQTGDPGPWKIPPEQLASMLKIERVQTQGGNGYQVTLDETALNTYLNSLAGDINRRPENARFMFNDETRLLEVIQPAVIGRNLDVFNTIQAVNAKVSAGEHSVPLTVTTVKPEVGDDAKGEQLGITEQIIAYTSYFRGSTTERLQNIEKAAANFHGLLIAPGATFSMADAMGNVSLDSGYAEAWIIYGGRTIKGVGGGVCQVSTTLFRAAFFAGYPIVERHPHAYRVGYYEQTANDWDSSLAGLDATVFVPMVDFKFVNNSPHWLLMETYFRPNSRSLTWKFYSTSDGRTVEWDTSGPENVIEAPDPVYEENPELAQGQIEQVDWEAEGADVTVIRTVYRDGVALFTDSFITHYLPWAAVYQYGPGTTLPNEDGSRPWKKR